eukprot:scaffold32247_cov35-Tisochrysis_lutea.AAC.1
MPNEAEWELRKNLEGVSHPAFHSMRMRFQMLSEFCFGEIHHATEASRSFVRSRDEHILFALLVSPPAPPLFVC